MAVATHPSVETLASFARGNLPPAELASVAEHIAGCAACCASLSRVPDDTLGNLARAAGGKTASPATPTAGPGANPPPAASPKSDIPPALADHPRYKVLRELGAGGMGVVYKAEHRIMGRLVALKVMAPHLTAKNGAVERFRKEVRAAAQLGHPNIVTAHDADEAGGMHFLVMEYVEGLSLDRLVTKKGPLPVPMAAAFMRQAAQGLQHAHEKGMVHRDIKPQNLMVTKKAQVKVMDFGLARFVRVDEEEAPAPAGRLPFGAGKAIADPVTNPNLLMGTPDYLSPEQAKNSHNVDGRSDIYSLGCTLFFLLTGKPPFAHAPSLIDKLLAHTEEAPPAIRELRPDVPEGLAAVLNKMLSKSPDDRYSTAAEAAAALHPFLRTTAGDDKPAFEVVDAMVVAPASGVGLDNGAKTPSPAVENFAFDTEPVAEGVTAVEAEKPKKSKKKKAAKPWWKHPGAKIGAAAAALMLIAGVVALGKKKDPPSSGGDTANANTNANKPTQPQPNSGNFPLPITLPKNDQKGNNPWQNGGKQVKPILYVVPSSELHLPDYFSVVEALRQHGLRVETVSGKGGVPTIRQPPPKGPFGPPPPNWPELPNTQKLADVKASEYSAIIFCGAKVHEYVNYTAEGAVGDVTRKLLLEMQREKKPIGGICIGQQVLLGQGLLRGKSIAKSEYALRDLPNAFTDSKREITLLDVPCHADGNIITAAGAPNAKEFADLLAKAVKGE